MNSDKIGKILNLLIGLFLGYILGCIATVFMLDDKITKAKQKIEEGCNGGREIINQSQVYYNRDENRLLGVRYTLQCKDTGEIKIKEDFR